MWQSNFKDQGSLNPLFLTLSLSYPLGFACLLGAASHKSKVFVPSTYSLNSIAHAFKTQGADTLVCESAMYQSEVPEDQVDEIKQWTDSFDKVFVAGGAQGAESQLFGKGTNLDLYLA